MQQLVQNNSHRPDVVLDCVNVAFECLRCHIQWSTHIVILFAAEPTVPFSEPEIGDLVHTVFDKDVSGFEVPMQESAIG